MRTEFIKLNLNQINSFVDLINAASTLVLIDEHVYSIYKNKINDVKEKTNIKLMIIPRGELAKTFSSYEANIEKILATGITRKTHIIAIGGGATSDFVGFIASTILRGVEWSIVPTTLLSMIDASIGGKVAINSRYGKNLIGSFHKPRFIGIATEFLKTLEARELLSGYGELIKYCFLSKEIFNMVTNDASIDDIISSCCEYKESLTIRDYKEQGERKLLNVGHTIGHAIEKHFKIPHGIAVYHGIIIEAAITGNSKKIIEHSKKLEKHLPLEVPPLNLTKNDISFIVNFCFKDKKLISENEVEMLVIQDIEAIKSKIFTREALEKALYDFLEN